MALPASHAEALPKARGRAFRFNLFSSFAFAAPPLKLRRHAVSMTKRISAAIPNAGIPLRIVKVFFRKKITKKFDVLL
jgi:hypothetical protein